METLYVLTDYAIAVGCFTIAGCMAFTWLPSHTTPRWVKVMISLVVAYTVMSGVDYYLDAAMPEVHRHEFEHVTNVANAAITILAASAIVYYTVTRRGELKEVTDDRRRYECTFVNANVGMCWVDTEGYFMRVNDKLCHITGYDASELCRMTYMQITHQGDVEKDNELYARVQAGEIDTYTIDKRYIHKLGYPVWVRLTVSFIRNNGGDVDYAVSQIIDIDIEKRLLHKLQERVEDLEELRRVGKATEGRTRLDSLLESWHAEDTDG